MKENRCINLLEKKYHKKLKTVMLDKIINGGFCTGCGVCVSEDKSENSFMKENEYGFLVPDILETSLKERENMIRVCPFNPNPEEEARDEDKLASIFLNKASNTDSQIGKFENLYVGYANDYRETSSSGGIATFIFKELLRNKIVDTLFVVTEIDGSYGYKLFSSYEEIIKISKTRYIPVTLQELFLKINEIDGKIAVSGVGCFIKAIRLKQFYNPELKNKIPFLVGIICGGLKSRFFTDYLSQHAGIKEEYKNQDYRIKDKNSTSSDYSFGAYDTDNKFFKVKMKSLGDMWGTGLFKANACDFCDDVTTELADISLGDAWMQPYVKDGLGNSVIITRSSIADELIQKGIINKELTADQVGLTTFKKSQQGSFNHRHHALKYRIEKTKKKFKIIPLKRIRFFKNIPLEQKLVQTKRMTVRKKSIELWYKNSNIKDFESGMKYDLILLKVLTKLNHKIRKYRK